MMLTLVPNLISNLWKATPRPLRNNSHLMLAGINQTIFLSQWGVPEIKIGLDRLQGSFELDSISLSSEPDEMDEHTVWIYEKRNRIFFFKKGKLISHYRWSEFKEKSKNVKERMPSQPPRMASGLLSTTLSLAA